MKTTSPPTPHPFWGWTFLLLFVIPILPGNLAGEAGLNLPPRLPDAPSGLEIKEFVAPLALTPRENALYTQIAQGNIPDFLRNLVPITTNTVINGVNHTITYHVTPDYLAVGSDEDYFLIPMTPLLGQRLANLLDCSLPTRKMVNQIWATAPVKLAPWPIAPSSEMTTVPVFYDHNLAVGQQRAQVLTSHPLGALVGGTKKDVILSNVTATRPLPLRVCIYGWHQLDGSPIQPLSTVHGNTYADYSHGVRLVQNTVTVNGAPMTVQQVLADPALAILLSDEGVIQDPKYPLPNTAPVIVTEPFSLSTVPGAGIIFRVIAIGENLSYQWRRNGADLLGETSSELALSNVQGGNAGVYSVVVSNHLGMRVSRPAWLRIRESIFPALFEETFDEDNSADWLVFEESSNNVPDYTLDWRFNYGTERYTFNGVSHLVPPSPNSRGGSTRGLKITVNNNDTLAAITGVNLYPKNKHFSGDYVLRFDMWMNYPGASGGLGATGSTETAIFGINHLGTQSNWQATANVPSTDGLWFGATGEGGVSPAYRSFVGNLSGVQTELIGTSGGLIATDRTDPFYQALFPSSRFETPGAPGKNWVEVELIQTGNVIIWKLDGVVVAERTNDSPFTAGNIMLGYMDTFASIASPLHFAFVIFDNVRVEDLGVDPLAPPEILQQPQDQKCEAGGNATFEVQADGSATLRYQWRFNGAKIPGATASSYSVTNASASDAGSYSVVISNDAGSLTSFEAKLVISFGEVRFVEPAMNGEGHFEAELELPTNAVQLIEASSDLFDWTVISVLGGVPGMYSFVDSEAGLFSRRFYQAREGNVIVLTHFNESADGAVILFRNPITSGSTSPFIEEGLPEFSRISSVFPPGKSGGKVLHVSWTFKQDATTPWLRLTTNDSPRLPNPTIGFDHALRFTIYSDQPVYVAVGLRETETLAPVGSNGGVDGPIEWIGVSSENTPSPRGRLVSAGHWRRLTYLIPREPVRAFTGNGLLESTTGKGVLEHLALTPAGQPVGPFNVYLDDFEIIPLSAFSQ